MQELDQFLFLQHNRICLHAAGLQALCRNGFEIRWGDAERLKTGDAEFPDQRVDPIDALIWRCSNIACQETRKLTEPLLVAGIP